MSKKYIKLIKDSCEFGANPKQLSEIIFKILDIDIDEAIIPFYDKDGDWDFDTYDKEYILEQLEKFIKTYK